MKLLRDLMITKVFTCEANDTLEDAENMMKEHNIRHLPIVAGNQIVGLLSQKEFLAEAFRITDKFGAHNLRTYLAKTSIEQCMRTDLSIFSPDTPLAEAAQALLSKRTGCLIVADEQQQLLGIVSSKDFVRLAITLLQAS